MTMVQTKFHNLLCSFFNLDDLRALCFDLNVNYENIPGDSLEVKARELIFFCHRYGQLEFLLKRCHELRPAVLWPDGKSLTEALNKYFENFEPNLKSNAPSPLHQSIHGNYNAVSGHGGQSTVNVTNIHKSIAEEPAELLKRGIELLHTYSFAQALNVINSSIELSPSNPKAHYYYAIATLGTARPKLLNLTTIKTVESHLQTAIELDPHFGQAYILWAFIKYDYYVMNSIYEKPPTFSQLLKYKWLISQEEINELKVFLDAPKNKVWEWLQTL